MQPFPLVSITYLQVNFTYPMRGIIQLNIYGARILIGICYDKRHLTRITDISTLITSKGKLTGISRRVAEVIYRTFLTVFLAITV
jgi:hypothetical protein